MARPTTESARSATDRGIFPEAVPAAIPAHTAATIGAFPWADRMPALERYGALTARILLSQIFIMSGAMKFMDWSGNQAMMAKHGMVMIPFFLAAAAIVELVCGLSILLGYKSRVGALGLFLYLIP